MFDYVPLPNPKNSCSSNNLAAKCEQCSSSLMIFLPLRHSDTDFLGTIPDNTKILVRESQLLETDAE